MNPTILEVCQQQRWPYPISHSDGVAFFRACQRRAISTNVDECKMARIARGEVSDPYPPELYPPQRVFVNA